MKRIIITLCICTAWVASTYAQYPYTLKKCLEEGLANNYSIRITRNEEQISHNNATLANVCKIRENKNSKNPCNY